MDRISGFWEEDVKVVFVFQGARRLVQLLLAAELEIKGSFAAVFMSDISVWDETTNETVPMYEYFHRHAQLDSARGGVRLLPAAPREG